MPSSSSPLTTKVEKRLCSIPSPRNFLKLNPRLLKDPGSHGFLKHSGHQSWDQSVQRLRHTSKYAQGIGGLVPPLLGSTTNLSTTNLSNLSEQISSNAPIILPDGHTIRSSSRVIYPSYLTSKVGLIPNLNHSLGPPRLPVRGTKRSYNRLRQDRSFDENLIAVNVHGDIDPLASFDFEKRKPKPAVRKKNNNGTAGVSGNGSRRSVLRSLTSGMELDNSPIFSEDDDAQINIDGTSSNPIMVPPNFNDEKVGSFELQSQVQGLLGPGSLGPINFNNMGSPGGPGYQGSVNTTNSPRNLSNYTCERMPMSSTLSEPNNLSTNMSKQKSGDGLKVGPRLTAPPGSLESVVGPPFISDNVLQTGGKLGPGPGSIINLPSQNPINTLVSGYSSNLIGNNSNNNGQQSNNFTTVGHTTTLRTIREADYSLGLINTCRSSHGIQVFHSPRPLGSPRRSARERFQGKDPDRHMVLLES